MLYRGAMIEPTKVNTKIAKEIINHRDEIQLIKHNETQDLSRGSRACRYASPHCVPLHHVVRWLISITHRAS
jgi:hypothetical protein